MNGLTVRWSLAEAGEDMLDQLQRYVSESSHPRFTGKEGLAFKTWRARAGEWFEGSYVFASDEERERFQETFTATAAESPVSQLIGGPPIVIEACEIIGIAEGGAGFSPAS